MRLGVLSDRSCVGYPPACLISRRAAALCPIRAQASYALGYNLAIEYLADYEKTWMLDSFRQLDERIFRGEGKKIDWIFLEVHAEGEAGWVVWDGAVLTRTGRLSSCGISRGYVWNA